MYIPIATPQDLVHIGNFIQKNIKTDKSSLRVSVMLIKECTAQSQREAVKKLQPLDTDDECCLIMSEEFPDETIIARLFVDSVDANSKLLDIRE